MHLIGHSYGGAVSLHVALQRPERVRSLALYEPVLFAPLRDDGGGDEPDDQAPLLATHRAAAGGRLCPLALMLNGVQVAHSAPARRGDRRSLELPVRLAFLGLFVQGTRFGPGQPAGEGE